VDVVVYPDRDTRPDGHVNPGNGKPFGVLCLTGKYGDARIQFLPRMTRSEQAEYFRALADEATKLADELDPPKDGAE
jgi:hypothetical protein